MAGEDEAAIAIGDGGGSHDPGHVGAAVRLRQGERTTALSGEQPLEGAPVGGAGAVALEYLGHGILCDQEGCHGRGAGTELFEHDQLVPDVAVTVQADPQDAHLRQGPEQIFVEGLGFVERVHAVLGGHVPDELANALAQLGALRGVGDWVSPWPARSVRQTHAEHLTITRHWRRVHAHHCSQCTTWAVSTRRPGLKSWPRKWATGIRAHCMTES